MASSRRFRHKRADFFSAAIDLDECAKNDSETERPPSHRHGRQHRRMNNNNNVRDYLDIPPLPRPLQLSKEWRPLQTSTLSNFYATKLSPIAPLEPPRCLFDTQYTAMCCGISSTDEFNKPARPEQFNLPSVMAKAKGIRGILFLQLCVTGDSVLKVQVRNGAYFLKSLPISSFVKVEIRRCISRRRDKYAAAHHQQQKRRFCSRVTYPVSQDNQPEFYEQFTFQITRTHLEHGDKLGISVFVQLSGEENPPELLGGMSFSLVKMIKMAHLHTTSSQQRFFHFDDYQSHLPMGDVSVKLYEGGFFLLPDKKALTTKFAQDKISIRKYYDDIGGCSTTTSTTTSSTGSPFRVGRDSGLRKKSARDPAGGLLRLPRHTGDRVCLGSPQPAGGLARARSAGPRALAPQVALVRLLPPPSVTPHYLLRLRMLAVV
uniref:C2 domain-containing protein n=1 Tax=Globodera pallida TaxID=36090 RepID=A0A183BS27_GLOPA